MRRRRRPELICASVYGPCIIKRPAAMSTVLERSALHISLYLSLPLSLTRSLSLSLSRWPPDNHDAGAAHRTNDLGFNALCGGYIYPSGAEPHTHTRTHRQTLNDALCATSDTHTHTSTYRRTAYMRHTAVSNMRFMSTDARWPHANRPMLENVARALALARAHTHTRTANHNVCEMGPGSVICISSDIPNYRNRHSRPLSSTPRSTA